MNARSVDVDIERILTELETLSDFSDAPAPAVTRVLFTPTDRKARCYLKDLCYEAGLSVRQDPVGNLFARWEGTNPEMAPVATGSHTDAIPFSGRYDGTVGVLGALEAFRALRRAGFEPQRSLELLIFTAEEPTRFGLGCLGSRALCGALEQEALRALRDAEGVTFEEARRVGGCKGALESFALPEGYYAAFVELHIEQGPLLEAGGYDIGNVTAIAAPAALRVHLHGEGGHAGAVLMAQRHDALLAGAEIALAVEAAAHATGSPDTVATVGIFQVHPGAINSIASRALLEIDARDTDLSRRDAVVRAIRAAIEEIGRRRNVLWECEVLNADPPAVCAPTVIEAIEAACTSLGFAHRPLVSRAYHDTLFMARIAPVGMIFIPCRGGVSHRPDEYSTPEQIRRGVETLALTLAQLATHPID